ncbi:hypothetical protein GGR00_001221 [Aminobacter aganoensis]|uniref:Uncharacterized protein n=1 Tax=Aminobacter aganoensis TaxID=83264 RepID=A0A7X0F5R3_9HYPH|nr:hypothetical protein [Aminobacter aganoensis]
MTETAAAIIVPMSTVQVAIVVAILGFLLGRAFR